MFIRTPDESLAEAPPALAAALDALPKRPAEVAEVLLDLDLTGDLAQRLTTAAGIVLSYLPETALKSHQAIEEALALLLAGQWSHEQRGIAFATGEVVDWRGCCQSCGRTCVCVHETAARLLALAESPALKGQPL